VKIQEPPKCPRPGRHGTGPLYIYMSAPLRLPVPAMAMAAQIRRVSHLIPSKFSRLSFPCGHAGELTQLTVTDQGNYGILTGRSLPMIPLAPSDDRPKPQREPGGSPPRLAPPIAMAANSGTSTTSPLFCRMRQPLHDH
jgi:hypothetical protein